MTLPRPEDSHAVLIGTSQYHQPPFAEQQLPMVADNLQALRDTLTDPQYGGFLPENCTVLHHDLSSTAGPGQLQRALLDAARKATDTLLVYYAGHGWISHGKLYLTLPQTDPDLPETTALDYDTVRRTVLENGQRLRLVVILDSCHAGLALPARMGGDGLGLLEIEGTYVLTAAGPYESAWATAQSGSPYTTFTGALLEQLRTGDPQLPETLTLNGLFPRLEAALSRVTDADGNHPPTPLRVNHQTAGDLALTRNRKPGGGQALVLDLRDGGVVAASRLSGGGLSALSLSPRASAVSIATALAVARGPGRLLHDRVMLVVPADWDSGRREHAIAQASAGGADQPASVLRPVAAARYAIRELNIEVRDGMALAVHEHGLRAVTLSVLVRDGERWLITDTAGAAGAHSAVDGRRLTNRTLIRSEVSRLVVGMLLLTPELGPDLEKDVATELASLDIPVYPVVDAWEALSSGALAELPPKIEAPQPVTPPAVVPQPASQQPVPSVARPTAATVRLAVLATGLGGVGFTVLYTVVTIQFWPAAGVAVTAAVASYLGGGGRRSLRARPSPD